MRINRTIDFIREHYDEELNLDRLASIACFSKFHFHRLFRTIVGETLSDFVQRIRLEKSVQKLTTEAEKSITEIALECGFSCSQNYARVFKAHYGVSPSVIRREFNWNEWKVKISKLKGKCKDNLSPAEAYLYETYLKKGKLSIDDLIDERPTLDVSVRNLPDIRVAYVRSLGPYTAERIAPAFRQLFQWATPRGLVGPKVKVLSVWANPSVTPEDKLIHDACIGVPESVGADKWVDVQVLPGGLFAIYHCETSPAQLDEAWKRLTLNWLISSDYQPDDRPLYQIYCNNPATHPSKHCVLALCLPVKPLFE